MLERRHSLAQDHGIDEEPNLIDQAQPKEAQGQFGAAAKSR
jgi:hypothetical protein